MIYFDNAATSRFKPKEVINAVNYEIKHTANPGRSSHEESIKASIRLYQARQKVAEYYNANQDEVIFTSGCTEAINLLLFGLNLNGHVVTTIFEHNSVLRTLKQLELKRKIKLTIIKPNYGYKITVKDLENSINADTKLFIVNHISNVTGTKQDLKILGDFLNKKGIMFAVDDAQGFGHFKTDLKMCNVDFMVGAGHKGINGIQGTGFLIARKKEKLKPIKFGGTGISTLNLIQENNFPDDYEAGTQNMIGINALNSAIQWHENNEKYIEKKYNELNDNIFYLLNNIGKKYLKLYTNEKNNVYSFTIKNIFSNEVANILSQEYNICTRSGLHCAPLIHKYFNTENDGMIRVSLGFDNTAKEILKLIDGLEKIIRKI